MIRDLVKSDHLPDYTLSFRDDILTVRPRIGGSVARGFARETTQTNTGGFARETTPDQARGRARETAPADPSDFRDTLPDNTPPDRSTGAGLFLAPSTLEAARSLMPGADVHALADDWRRHWQATGRPRISDPDAAFLGFVRRRARTAR